MTEPLHLVDRQTCVGDGLCADVCPSDVLEVVDGLAATIEEHAGLCIECGQCVAICPTESIRMPGLTTDRFERLSKRPFGYDAFNDFLRLRRSIRVFKDESPPKRRFRDYITER